MDAGDNPGFVGHARGVGAEGDEIPADFDDALILSQLLGKNVTKNAAFFGGEVVAAGTKFVQHATGNERRGGELEGRGFEFLGCSGAVVLDNAVVLKARVSFQI